MESRIGHAAPVWLSMTDAAVACVFDRQEAFGHLTLIPAADATCTAAANVEHGAL
jgi:hypothetical protein